MIRSIMVPLDGSKFGEWALPHAVSIARRTGATIDLVVVHVPFMLTPTPDASGFTASTDEAAREALEEYARETCTRVVNAAHVDVKTSALCGSVRPMLLDHARDTAADLIVMTTHGRGPFQRMWLGSVADGVVRHATVPILLVRPVPDRVADPAAGAPVHHVLVALDGSDVAEAVLPRALELADLYDAAITLVRVVEPPFVMAAPYGAFPPPTVDDQLLRALRAAAGAYLDDLADRLRRADRAVGTRVILQPNIAGALLEERERLGADLIALATHGRGRVGRLMLGSVADKVVRGAHVPVLIVRPEH